MYGSLRIRYESGLACILVWRSKTRSEEMVSYRSTSMDLARLGGRKITAMHWACDVRGIILSRTSSPRQCSPRIASALTKSSDNDDCCEKNATV